MVRTQTADDAVLPTSRLFQSGPLFGATLLASLVAGSGIVLGFTEIDANWAIESLSAGKGALGDLGFVDILSRNVFVALLLYSGVITLGISTLGGLITTSLFVGATMSVGITNSGVGGLLSDTGAYLPFEFAGLLVAGVAGLYPLISALLAPSRAHRGFWSSYLQAIAGSLCLLGLALALISVGAAVEAVLLASR